jgi:hypothetical protein
MPRPQPWLQGPLCLPSPFAQDFTHRAKLKLFSFAHLRKYVCESTQRGLLAFPLPLIADRRRARLPILRYIANI